MFSIFGFLNMKVVDGKKNATKGALIYSPKVGKGENSIWYNYVPNSILNLVSKMVGLSSRQYGYSHLYKSNDNSSHEQ